MSGVEFRYQDKFHGTVRWLESQVVDHRDDRNNPEDIIIASQVICDSCPTRESCNPRYGYTTVEGERAGVVVSGAEIISGACLLNDGISADQLKSARSDASTRFGVDVNSSIHPEFLRDLRSL